MNTFKIPKANTWMNPTDCPTVCFTKTAVFLRSDFSQDKNQSVLVQVQSAQVDRTP